MSAVMAREKGELISLPQASIQLSLNLDRLRLAARPNSELRSLLVQAGDRRLLRDADLDRVRELVAST